MIAVYRYQAEDGSEPFTDWFNKLGDRQARARIEMRLTRIEAGNFGDCKRLRNGVSELRIDWGAGYRVYYGMIDQTAVLLLAGGDKRKQEADIVGYRLLPGFQTETEMKRKLMAAVSHHDRVIEELRADREYAREYLRAAMEEDPAVMLIALRRIAEAYGGLAKIAEKAEIQRESLYRALSPNGNPTLKTFTAVLNAVGMRLSVETIERKRRAA